MAPPGSLNKHIFDPRMNFKQGGKKQHALRRVASREVMERLLALFLHLARPARKYRDTSLKQREGGGKLHADPPWRELLGHNIEYPPLITASRRR